MTIPEIFAKHGEPYFRAGEARVIARLLDGGPQVLATGGGAVMDADTRALIRDKGISVWLKADLDVLLRARPSGATTGRCAEKIEELAAAARTGLCAVRHRRAVARRAARHHRRRDRRRAARSALGGRRKPSWSRAMTAAAAPPSRSWCRSRWARAPTTSSSAAACSASLGARMKRCVPAPRRRIVTDATVARAASRALPRRRSPAPASNIRAIVVPPGESVQELRHFRDGVRGGHRRAHRARRSRSSRSAAA